MEKYSIISTWYGESIRRASDTAFIPFALDNTDYQQFLKDWEAGATVLSSTGVPLPWGSDPS